MLSCLYCAVWFFSQMAELLVLVFYVGRCSDYVLAFTLFIRKLEIRKSASFSQYFQNLGPSSHSLPLPVNPGLHVQL